MEQYTYVHSFIFFRPTSYKKISSSTRREPSPFSSWAPPEIHINFELSCEPRDSHWVAVGRTRARLLGMSPLPTITKLIQLNLDQFLNQENARQIIAEEVKSWPMPDDGRQNLIDFALDKAHEIMKSMPVSHNAVYINISVAPTKVYIFNEREANRWATQRSVEEQRNCIIPVAYSVMELLESRKIIINVDNFGTCSVCLEKFSKGCEAVCMPCSHVFHGGCIKNWLVTCHYGPICRSEVAAYIDFIQEVGCFE